MSRGFDQEFMLDMFIFETMQLIEQLEQSIVNIEKSCDYTEDITNEILRIMHTIKTSSEMMTFDNISALSYAIEDLFYCLREGNPKNIDCSKLTDILSESIDFIKIEMEKIICEKRSNGDASAPIINIKSFLSYLVPKDS